MDENNMTNNTNETESTYTSAFDNPVSSGATPDTTASEPKVETEVIPPKTQTTADGSVYYSNINTNDSTTSSENFNNYYTNTTNTSSTISSADDYSIGFAIASLVMGILGLLSCCCIFCINPGPIFDILGIIFYCLQKKDEYGKKPTAATIGLVLSIVGLLACIIMYLFVFIGGGSQAYLDALQNI